MSVTAVGPATAIDGPRPVAPPYSLLSIPGVLVVDDDRWMNGAVIYGYPEDTPHTWEPCSSGTFRTKEDESDHSLPRFDPFGLYTPETCSASSSAVEMDAYVARAAAALEATQSFAVEEALSQGVTLSTNPYFGDVSLTILAGGAAQTPEVGLRYLEDAIGATGRMGIIHATPATVAAWEFEALKTDGSYIQTPNGTPVASGGGYIGADPVSGSSPAAGQAWAFATGPVEVRISDMQLIGGELIDALDTSNNDVTVRAEKFALATWDTALQAGVLIDWTP